MTDGLVMFAYRHVILMHMDLYFSSILYVFLYLIANQTFLLIRHKQSSFLFPSNIKL